MPAIPTRQFVMSAVFGAALAAAPTAPTQAQGADPVPKGTQADQIKADLDAIKADVDALKRFRAETVDAVYGKSDGGRSQADQGLFKRMGDLDAKLTQILSRLDALEKRMADPGRSTTSSGYVPYSPAAAPRATIRVVNDYATEMSIIINRQSYRLLPGETRAVEVPAGSFTYELLHAGAQPVPDTVREGQTVTLRIR